MKPEDKPGRGDDKDFVDDVAERWDFYRQQRQQVLQATLENWDLYLTKKHEFRSKGEEWRANLALPDAFANVEVKVANLVSIMLSADPVVQPEGVLDSGMESARSVERIIDYVFRKNSFSKFLIKLCRARSVAGTAFFKLTWVEQAHTVTLSRDANAIAAFEERLRFVTGNPALQGAVLNMPNWMTDPVGFEQWRKLVNDSGQGKIPAPPVDGPQRIITYRGPKLHILPISAVYLDPLIDELGNQNFLIHRVVKPQSWLEKRVKDGLYDAQAVALAMEGWDGQVVEDEETQLALKMGLITDSGGASDPYYSKAVELWETWQPGAEKPYTLILNRRTIINKAPGEMPFLHGEIAVGATRGVVVPGHFYGISDLTPPKDLFWEKRKLRNLRVDAVTLNVLPAYSKLKEVGLPEMMHKIRPGALIPMSRPDAIKPLVREPLPPEAYREPDEMDSGIADSMGVYASTKGAPAQIGRVTGTEFQGRENRASIRFKLDSIFLEEDLYPLNKQIIAMFAQMGDDPLIVKVGGTPNPIIEMSRSELMEAMETQWRFRGPNKAINRDMQVQQLLMWTKTFGQAQTPAEFRATARLILDLEDIRGASVIISDAGTQEKVQEYEAAKAAQQAQQGANQQQADVARQSAPGTVDADAANAMEGK